jgi:hypothetical protein
VSAERRKLLEHLGGFERVIRYALQDLDEETFGAFIDHVIRSIANLQIERLDEAWRREA